MSKTLTDYINFRIETIKACQEKYQAEADYWRGQLSEVQTLAQMIDMGELEGL